MSIKKISKFQPELFKFTDENLKKAENNLIDWATDTSTDLNNPDSRAGFFRAAGRLGISTERAFELFEKFVEPKQEPVVLSQGSYLVYPETGEVVARAPVKETITHKIIPSSKTDPNIRVFENGVQIEVIPVYAAISGTKESLVIPG